MFYGNYVNNVGTGRRRRARERERRVMGCVAWCGACFRFGYYFQEATHSKRRDASDRSTRRGLDGGRDEGQDQDEDVDDGTGNCFSMQIHIISRQSVATTTAIVVDTPTTPPLANEIIFSICISFFYGFAFEKNFTDRCFTVFYFLSFCFHVSHFLCVFYFIYCAAHRLLPATVIDTHRSGLMNVVETFN